MSNPIVEAVLDVLFESEIPAIGLVGLLLTADLKYKTIKELPTLQLPEIIRKNDPNLKYQALYEVRSKENRYRILIGDCTFGIAICSSYNCWKDFKEEFKEVFDKVFFKMKPSIKRIALRYVDIIDSENIFENGKINISIDGSSLTNKRSFLNIDYVDDSNIRIIQALSSHTAFQNQDLSREGSLVDTVTAIEDNIPSVNLEDFFYEAADKLHDAQIDLFKKVISNELILKLSL